ncbi:MAG: hypothetical protein GY761_12605 [Hyphomicrobiales bacterium]|nr:hypothetical protein [Hyphomicrobiales bacterium]
MNIDTLGRRSRFKRTPSGKRLVITERDIDILRWLYRYRYLRAPQLILFLKPKSEKRFIERLGDLFHETGLIDRPKAQWQHFDARCTPMIYELTIKGLGFLESRNQLPQRATTLSRQKRAGRNVQFDHAMMIVDVLVDTELATIATPAQRFVCIDEILARATETTKAAPNPLSVPVTIQPNAAFPNIKSPWKTHIIPDALYGIEYFIEGEKRYRFWALECENTSPRKRRSVRKSSLLRKQAAYNALIKSGAFKKHWGIPNLKLHVCTRKDAVKIRRSFVKS